MPRWNVFVNFEKEAQIKVWAPNEDAAIEKACEIVRNWDGVKDATAYDADEIEE